jgi:hypothetical protein
MVRYEYKLSCRAPVEFWSNVLPSATGYLHLTEEVVRTRSGVAVAEQKRFFAESCPACREGGSLQTGIIRNRHQELG